MASELDSRVIRVTAGLSRAAAVFTAACGILVVAGWALGIERAKSIVPGFVTMKPQTALCFVFAGLALWFLDGNPPRKMAGRFCAACTGLIGLVITAEYALGWNSGIDQLLFRDAVSVTNIPYPGRMAPATAGLFITLALALLLLDYETPGGLYPSAMLALIVALGGAVALLGYLYSVRAVSEFQAYTSLGLHTTVLLVVIGLGTFFAQPWRGPAAVIASPYAGGFMARLILPVAIGLPYIIGWLRQAGERAGFYGTSVGLAAFSTANILLFTTMIWLIARALNRVDAERHTRQEHDARLAAIVGNSGDAIFGSTVQGVITSWNKGAENTFGYTESEVLGQSVSSLMVPAGRESEPAYFFTELSAGRTVLGYETVRKRKDGSQIRVSLTLSPIADGKGNITGVAAIVRDITANKRIEADLRASEDRLREHARVLDLAQVLVRDQDDRIVLWNRGCELLYGFSQQEAIGRVSHALLRTEFPEPLEQVKKKLQETGAWEGELVHYKKDGTRIFVASKWVLHAASGKSPRVLEANTDITALKRAEDSLIQAQKMQAMGTLAGGIAHDFNNILLAISGHAGFAAEDLPADHPVQKDIAEIRKAGSRATDLVRQILTFSRGQETKRSLIRLQPVVEEALRMLRSTLPAMIEINATYDPAAPQIMADPTQIHQIVLNLCTNAAHAMGSSGGLLELRLSQVLVDPDLARTTSDLREGPYVRLSVSDSGSGMDSDTQRRIFDPFFTTKAPGKGTGLGLAVVHGIVKSHGGAISLYSEPGRGTTFQLYFPAMASVAGSAPVMAPAVPRGEGQHILCVDDEKPILSILSKTLTRLGYRVTAHGEASSALQDFRTRPAEFHGVVTDLALRGMSGLDLAEALRNIRPEIPVLMTSGYFSPEDSERANRLGIHELILKPNTLNELASALHRVLKPSETHAAGTRTR